MYINEQAACSATIDHQTVKYTQNTSKMHVKVAEHLASLSSDTQHICDTRLLVYGHHGVQGLT